MFMHCLSVLSSARSRNTDTANNWNIRNVTGNRLQKICKNYCDRYSTINVDRMTALAYGIRATTSTWFEHAALIPKRCISYLRRPVYRLRGGLAHLCFQPLHVAVVFLDCIINGLNTTLEFYENGREISTSDVIYDLRRLFVVSSGNT